jgi:hypothetical protein
MKACQEVVVFVKKEASQENIEAIVDHCEGVPHAGATLLTSLRNQTSRVLHGVPEVAVCEETYQAN